MPTALERTGDFSQTTTTTGKLIPIIDPTNRKRSFPGNIIPASRISPAGYAMLNLFPLPFTTDPTGQRQYNAIYQFSLHDPHEDRILRLDYNVEPQDPGVRAPDERLSGRPGHRQQAQQHWRLGRVIDRLRHPIRGRGRPQ